MATPRLPFLRCWAMWCAGAWTERGGRTKSSRELVQRQAVRPTWPCLHWGGAERGMLSKGMDSRHPRRTCLCPCLARMLGGKPEGSQASKPVCRSSSAQPPAFTSFPGMCSGTTVLPSSQPQGFPLLGCGFHTLASVLLELPHADRTGEWLWAVLPTDLPGWLGSWPGSTPRSWRPPASAECADHGDQQFK